MKEPRVPTFSGVGAIFVVTPYESIFNQIIEMHVIVVYGIRYYRRESSVERLSVLTAEGENIFNRKVEVMNVNNRDKRSNKTMGAPVIEPKRGGS